MAIIWADRIQIVEGDITALDVNVILKLGHFQQDKTVPTR